MNTIRFIITKISKIWILILLLTLGLSPKTNAQNPTALDRPQTPSFDVPYKTEEISFLSPKANVLLAGTLTIPMKRDRKYPCVVLVSDFGAHNRDEEMYGHQPFWILADFFSQHGFAVLRYDDRGSYQSKGHYPSATLEDFAADANAAIQYLHSRKDIDQVGIVGHGEGASVAMIASVQKPNDIQFQLYLAGLGIRGDSANTLERKAYFKDMNREQERNLWHDIYPILLENPHWSHGMVQLKKEVFDYLQLANPSWSIRTISLHTDSFTQNITPERYAVLRFSPASYLPQITTPILAIGGSSDKEVDNKINLSAIKRLTTNNKNVSIVEFPGLNHLFQESITGNTSEYRSISQTFSPKVMQTMLDWMQQIMQPHY